jgi:hypothetical protein
MYLSQVALLGGVILLVLRRSSFVLRAQVIVWMIGVTVLILRFGLTEQLNFYSNDQRYYASVVRDLVSISFVFDLDWWLSGSKIAYTFPAALLAGIGIDAGLALKTVSLLCFLNVTHEVLGRTAKQNFRSIVGSLFITACGGIGLFFSSLALRETMLMMLTTHFILSRTQAKRLLVLVLIVLLRPHLAAALCAATILLFVWQVCRPNHRATPIGSLILGIVSTFFGWLLFAFRVWNESGIVGIFGYSWGIDEATRIASNFVGLQFLTARSETLGISLANLFVLRLVLLETLLIPTIFTIMIFVRSRHLTQQGLFVWSAFSIYIGLVTNTDFNSFRQNVPFMTAMGLLILGVFSTRERDYDLRGDTSLVVNSGETSS